MATKPNAFLVIGAGPLQRYMIREAKKLGFAALATDGDKYAVGFADADDSYVVDTYNIPATLAMVDAMAASWNIRGVATCGADVAPTVAACAEALGLRSIPMATALLTHDKLAVRAHLRDAGLDRWQPRWTAGTLGAVTFADAQRMVGASMVVKPLSQRASRGVSIVNTEDAFHKALQKVAIYGETFLIEEQLVGTEYSAEILLDKDRDLVHYHCCERLFDYTSGTGIEIGHINPAPYFQDANNLLLDCAEALGVHFGSFKIDMMLTEDGPRLLECTARCSGGFDSQVTYPLSTNVSLLSDIIAVSVTGYPFQRHKVYVEPQCYAACAAVLPRESGAIAHLPSLRDLDGAHDLLWIMREGDAVQSTLEHCAQRPGFVIATDQTRLHAWMKAKRNADLAADLLGFA